MIKRMAILIFLMGLLPAYAGSGGELAPDVPVRGEIAERGEQDIYTFRGENRQNITLTVTAESDSSLDTVLELYDPDGEFLASNDDAHSQTTNSQIQMTLSRDGEYRVLVQAFAGATVGEYELLLTLGGASASTPESNGNSLIYNESYSGVLEGSSELDYLFTGTAGQRLNILVNGEMDSLLEVYAPSGEQIATDDDGGPELNPFIRNLLLPEDGDYRLVIRSYPNEPTGDYELILLELESLAGEIVYDSSIDSRIDENQVAFYQFEGAVGDSLQVALNGEFDTYLQVRNSAGVLVAEDDDSGGNSQAALTLTLSQNDRYTLEVMGFSPSDFGDYNLSLSLLNQVQPLAENQSIAYGETIEAALGGGESATLIFSAAAGDTITILVTATFDSHLSLFDSAGNLLAEDDDSGPGLNPTLENFTINTAGDYRLELKGYAEQEGGRFSLTLSSGNSIASPGGESASLISYDETASGELNASGLAEFSFAGVAGESISIRVQADFDSFAQLFQPNGNLLASDDDGGGDLNPLIENITLPETGDYKIVLRAFDASARGSYSLTLEQSEVVTDAPPSDTATIMLVGDTLAGRVNLAGIHTAIFNANAGDVVSISATATSWFGDLDLYLRLIGPNGEVLAEDDDGGWLFNPALYAVELPETGTYTLETSSFEGSTEGDFSLSLAAGLAYLAPDGSPAQNLDFNAGRADLNLNLAANEVALYQFEVAAGQTLSLETASNTIPVALYTPLDLAEVLLEPDFPHEFTFSGTYLLIAFTEIDAQDTISLTLSGDSPILEVVEAYSTQRGEVVADRPVRGTLQAAETQIWTFKPLLNGTYNIVLNSEDSDGRYDPMLRVRSADGGLLAEDDDSGGNFNALVEGLELLADQTISLEVSGFADQRGGNYLLVVVSQSTEPPPVLRGGTISQGSVVDNALLIPSQRIAFELLIPQDGIYTITLTGLKLPYVDINDAEGNLVARGVSGLVGQPFSAGTYTLTVYDRLNRTGGFSLSVE